MDNDIFKIEPFYITAMEAHKMTDEIIEKSETQELENIMKEIEREVKNGSYCLYGNGIISPALKEKLKTLGYEVDAISQYNEYLYKISW